MTPNTSIGNDRHEPVRCRPCERKGPIRRGVSAGSWKLVVFVTMNDGGWGPCVRRDDSGGYVQVRAQTWPGWSQMPALQDKHHPRCQKKRQHDFAERSLVEAAEQS